MAAEKTSLALCRQQAIAIVQDEKPCASPVGEGSKIWLVVGDGDLSYSATLAEELATSKSNTRLIASVLEEEAVHKRVYERSQGNAETISSYPSYQLLFGIDATKLKQRFPDTKFDCIEFNFPHWRGKTNARYNRILLDDFLSSASTVLKPDGEIRIALCHGQGGMPSESLQEWKQSWMAAMYSARRGLLLKRLEPYEPEYSLSSHRGADRPFFLGDSPQKLVFGFPDGECIDEALQLSCRHELRVMLDPEKLENSPRSLDEIVHGDVLLELAQEFIPDGIRFEIPARDLLSPYELKGGHVPLAVFLLNYSGERQPLTRENADDIRANIEAAIVDRWRLDVARGGRLVSKPYPGRLLPKLIKEYIR